MPEYTNTIEECMFELEDRGMINTPKGKDAYNMINELRCFMGEREFFEFLEYSMRCWGVELMGLDNHYDKYGDE